MISVIIPAYNAAKTIGGCLHALRHQDYGAPYEIIVVDDGSTDETPNLVSQYGDVRLLRQSNAGPAAARNKGVLAARGDIVLFTDADCVPDRNWISEMAGTFQQDPHIVGVKGAYRTLQREWVARFVQYEYEDKYDRMKKQDYIDFIDTYSAGFRKEIFLKTGGYDTAFPLACAEDVELSFRLSAEGYRMVFNPEARTCHIHPATLWGYLKKKYKFAFWRMLALKKNPGKIASDSHTPQTMKLQLLLAPLLLLSLLLQPLYPTLELVTALALVTMVGISLPFIIKTLRKDPPVGLVSLCLLFGRALSQFLGVLGGMAHLFHIRHWQAETVRHV